MVLDNTEVDAESNPIDIFINTRFKNNYVPATQRCNASVTITATARNFRLQVFGEQGWLELRGENELTWSPVNGRGKTWHHPPVSMVRLQLDAFATAIKNRIVYPVSLNEVINGLAACEGVLASLDSGQR